MKRCPSCQTPNPDNSKRCFKCRTDLQDVEPSVPAEAAAPADPLQQEEARRIEFALIMKGFQDGARKTLKAAAQQRELLVFLLLVLLAAGLMLQLKGFGPRLAAAAGALLIWFFYSLGERLLRALAEIRNQKLAELLRNRDDVER